MHLEDSTGGYGAIDAETATLAGLVTVDFAGLGVPPGVGDWVFELIVTGSGIFRGFDSVQFLSLADGYDVSFYGIVDQSEGLLAGFQEWHTDRFGLLYFGRDRDGA